MIKFEICQLSGCENEFIASQNKYGAFCSKICLETQKSADKNKKARKSLKNVSPKRELENEKYKILRQEFLSRPENKICFIDGCNRTANTIEHRAGRWGKNFLDTTTWAGCCSEHNIELENNPELAKKYQLSKIHGGSKL